MPILETKRSTERKYITEEEARVKQHFIDVIRYSHSGYRVKLSYHTNIQKFDDSCLTDFETFLRARTQIEQGSISQEKVCTFYERI
jgi:hypothetical protein